MRTQIPWLLNESLIQKLKTYLIDPNQNHR